jgi:DNA replication protein DnaC
MDPATEQHVEESRRPPGKSTPRRFDTTASLTDVPVEDLVTPDVAPDVLDASVRYTELRKNRAQEGLERKLDQMVPIEEVEVEDTLVWSGNLDDGPVVSQRITGTVWALKSQCSSCRADMVLLCEERPGLKARAVAAGVVRRRRLGTMCEKCILDVETAEERRETEEKLRERVSASELPKAMQGFEFSDMRTEGGRDLAIAAAREWALEEEPDPRGVCIFGDKGTGKTRLAATAMWQRLRQRHVTWVSWPILLAQLGAAFNDDARQQAISVLTGKGALVLDDIAQEEGEKVSDWARRQIFAAVDRRMQVGSPILITTNLGPAAIGEVLGEKMMSRIVGYCRVVELPGDDMRLRFTFDGSREK